MWVGEGESEQGRGEEWEGRVLRDDHSGSAKDDTERPLHRRTLSEAAWSATKTFPSVLCAEEAPRRGDWPGGAPADAEAQSRGDEVLRPNARARETATAEDPEKWDGGGRRSDAGAKRRSPRPPAPRPRSDAS